MNPKKFVMFGMVIGSFLGGWLPTVFGVSAFSITDVITTAIGGLLGIWITYRIST